MMIRKFIPITLCILTAVSLSACSPSAKVTETTGVTESTEGKTTEKEATEKETTEETTKETGEDKEETTKETTLSKADAAKMTAPGYPLGEIPPIPMPQVPDLSVTENPDAKITMEAAKKITSVPGITVTPIRIEGGNIVAGRSVMQGDGNGGGQYSDGNMVVQTDGNGSGQYSDDKIIIQRNEDGSGQLTNHVTKQILQVNADGSGQYSLNGSEVVYMVNEDGTGMYTESPSDIVIMVNADSVSYNDPNTTIYHNSDGSGTYRNKNTGLEIENDGKGKSVISLDMEEITVDAEPLGPVPKLDTLQMIPPVPSIEANSLLITFDAGVLFDVDKYDLRPESKEILNALATMLKDSGVASFEINGHTDSDASDEHNQTLSENRANSVKTYLEEQGVTASITATGFGEKQPVATNDTAEGKQQNRRVEVVIPVS